MKITKIEIEATQEEKNYLINKARLFAMDALCDGRDCITCSLKRDDKHNFLCGVIGPDIFPVVKFTVLKTEAIPSFFTMYKCEDFCKECGSTQKEGAKNLCIGGIVRWVCKECYQRLVINKGYTTEPCKLTGEHEGKITMSRSGELLACPACDEDNICKDTGKSCDYCEKE